MKLDWITPQQAAVKWGISDRRIQTLCSNGQVDGAVRLGRGWLIPKDIPRPIDGRTKAAKDLKAAREKR
ncbi:MAG: helix-turn-helix domain-containing protein [Synergistaceae bacterium]|nr:helix-turn-helix domain-containing protein [Synergistaceae bacterium]